MKNPSKVTFLGTGTSQGVPVIACQCPICMSSNPKDNRLRSSILVEGPDKQQVVVDTGPDFRQQMLREGTRRMDAVIYTHEHKDHIAGMDDVRAFNFIQKKSMDLYGNANVLSALKREYPYVFAAEKYPGIPQVDLHEIKPMQAFSLGGLEWIALPALHYKLPVLGFKIGGFAYITDANFLPPETMKSLENLDVLVLNALRREDHVSHFTLEQALELVKELKPKQAYFTHISHQLGLHDEVSKELPPGVALAYDGLQITF